MVRSSPNGASHKMSGEGFTIRSRIRNLLRSPSTKPKKNRKESLTSKVTLEKVLGITASGNSGLACDPRSGRVAYPAGCVVVLLNPKKNRQHHIINTSRKTITALCFSPDGKYLVTGESGHLPAVRLWDVAERREVAELQKHKYGISCVAFSPNSKYVVSVGNQHDMMVNVCAWKKNVVVAANKVSSKVTGVSFSEDSSYFVTVGNRHVKFWYLDHCKASKASAPVPLLGRSGLLGELRNNFFCDVACGRGSTSDSTFCITSSGLLCEFNSTRMLDKWVDLRTGVAQALSLSEDLIFCGCADGTVRAFSPVDLHFVCTLPRPHPLGSDVSAITEASHLFSTKTDARYPDTIAVTYDPVGQWLSCVYNDHSVYVWDVRDVNRVGKVHSALFHAACVGDLEMFPDVPGEFGACLSSGAFLSCSADNTIRLWRMDDWTTRVHSQNILSSDLLNIIYIDGNTSALLDPECLTNMNVDKTGDGQTAESRTGIRTICVSPDGKHLASGDRNGMLRVYDLSGMEEILKVEAHDAEILCLEYSKPETGLKLLATASRDRLIHVLDAEDDYSLVQTLDEHSSSITAVRFAANDNKVRMISCGADKSIYFRTAHKTDRGTEFRRSHHTVSKTTLYDMGVDPTCKYAAVGCQDRCVRIFNISSGKQKKLYKGSLSEDGSLLKVQLDPSGQYVATSCSDKNISIFEFSTGECVATMDGHSEIVTGMKFTNDCRHLISVSGDSCIFVWRLAPELTISMRERLCQLRQNPNAHPCKTSSLRREVYSAPTLGGLSSDSDREHEEEEEDGAENDNPEDIAANSSSDSSHGEEDTGGSDEGQDWELTKHGVVSQVTPDSSKRPRRRWSRRMGSLELKVKSMLDLRQLETFAPKKNPSCSPHDGERRSMSCLQEPVLEERAKSHRPWPHADWLSSSHPSKGIMGADEAVLYPEENEIDASLRGSDYMVKEQHCRMQGRGSHSESKKSRSPDSACSLGYDSRDSSPDRVLDDSADVGSLSQDSSDEENEEREEEEQKAEVTTIDEALRTVTDTADCSQEDFLKQNFETLEESSRMEQSRVPRLSMSSRFLARGHNNRGMPLFAKVQGKEHSSHSAKPLVSKVRPLMEDSQSRNTEEGPHRLDASERDGGPTLRPLKKRRSSGCHLWRLSNPPSKTPLLLDPPTCLQKSHSDQNLASDYLNSPVPSSDRREFCIRPQQLSLNHDTPQPSFHFSSPSSESPQSPQSPLSWESPKLKPHHSYMNPTASSMAKSSRSASLGEVIQMGTPLCSPTFLRDSRSCGELEIEPALLTSSPVAAFPSTVSSTSSLLSCPLPNSPSPAPPHPIATVSPTSFIQNIPPSRIPLPKQLLSPRRSCCLEGMSSLSCSGDPARVSNSTVDPGCDITPTPGNRALGRKLSLSWDPSLPSSLPVRQKKDSVSESAKDPLQVAVAKECPLVPEQAHASSADPQPGLASHNSFINLSIATVTPLHHSIAASLHTARPVCPSACLSHVSPSVSVPSCCQHCDYMDHSITLETCRQAVRELHNSLRKTATLYTTVLLRGQQPSEDQQEMRSILSEALFTVKAELDSLSHPPSQWEGPRVDHGVKGEGEKALALLEQYAELLLKSVERRLDTKT
ncbi:mitogen-activated protein kinase-binding protein 1-like isoform X2 [Sander lucioperca]|uniref:mitogen-activated protein kinase-binding protein 1-like isoform X2 n=1 Tax=Sander lucioperca TaxID=283035 RepID=UPI00125D5AF3|nr:mitogen-activated protein kinase-binding protein 1-like isoform X2 [Sander lucioperca]